MITRYFDYLDFLLENIIMKSKIEFSEAFYGLLKTIQDDSVSRKLITLKSKAVEAPYTQNFIDLSNKNDEVTFIINKKAQEIIGNATILYKVVEEGRYLTFSSRNQRIFNLLGFKIPLDQYGNRTEDPYDPLEGTIGSIEGEAKSTTGNIYVLFTDERGRRAVINKNALIETSDVLSKVWKSSRNSMKVGRLAKAILKSADVETTDKEIEIFVNRFKAAFDITNDAFAKFRVVKGDDIAYWYNSENYESMRSTLGNSCMAEVDSSYFDIYTHNRSCSLLILLSNNGTFNEHGKYVSDKIVGRALVWTVHPFEKGDDLNSSLPTETFMDRIYTIRDSDIDLFKKYAEREGWWYKGSQDSAAMFVSKNGKTSKSGSYIVKLQKVDFDNYPYMDTFKYMKSSKKLLSNNPNLIKATKELQDTDGSIMDLDPDDYSEDSY